MFYDYIIKHHDLIISHWNGEIDTLDLLTELNKS